MNTNRTAASIIAAGDNRESLELPGFTSRRSKKRKERRANLNSNKPKLYSALSEEGDDQQPDTDGFLWDDENIFETGGLPKSEPAYFNRRSSIVKKKTTPLAQSTHPGNEIFHNGEYYEFIGYAGDVELSDEELSSFEGEPGEYSDFLPLLGAFKVGKKLFKNRKKIGKGIKGLGKGIKGLKGIFRKRKKTQTARFDGLVEYEYFIGPDPVYSDLFGIKLKKIGKAIGKPFKAIGKGVKKVGKGIGSVGKFLGKNIQRGANLIKGSQETRLAEARAAEAQALANAGSGASVLDNGQFAPTNDQSYAQTPDYNPDESQAPYINPDNGEMVIPYDATRQDIGNGSGITTFKKPLLQQPVVIISIALAIILIAYLLKNRK